MKKFVLIFALALVYGCATTPTQREFETADYGLYPEKFEEIIKAYYSTILFDPYSAVYTFNKPVKAWNRIENIFGWVVCGTVNGKNRLGAYVGAKPFYILIRNNQVIVCYDSDPAFVDGVCRGSGAFAGN
jgi:hypothetical protein